MKSRQTRDLTQGSIYGNLLYMALPTMFGFFAQTLFSIVDMIYIGMISSEAIAGVTIYGSIFAVVYVFNDVIGTSSISLISQSYGQKNYERTSKVIEQTIVFKGLVALIAGLFMAMALKPLISFFTDDPVTRAAALDYGYIRTFFLPIMFSSYTVNTAMRCIGDSTNPLRIMVLTAIMNIILDPLFMFETINLGFIQIPGLGLGVFGAALATVVSSTFAFLLAFYILLRGKTFVKIRLKGLLKLDKEIDYKLVTIGLPNGLEGLNRNIANFILFKMIAHYGVVVVAAYGIVMRIMELGFMPLFGLNMGGSTIIGQNIGAKNLERVVKSIHATVIIGVGIMMVINIGALFLDKYLMLIFTRDQEVIKVGTTILRFIVPSMIFIAAMFGFGTSFSGSGFNRPFLISSVVSRWLILIPIASITTYVLKTGITGLLIAFVLSEFVSFIIILTYYKKGLWKSHRV